MNRKRVLAIILTVTTMLSISLPIALVGVIKSSRTYEKKAQEMKSELEQKSATLDEAIEQNLEYRNKVSSLEETVSETTAELEKARQRIQKINAVTYFSSSDVTSPSNATIVHISRALKGTKLIDVAQAFIDAESQYGINAYFLAAICAQESGWGSSNRAQYQNNLTGHAVYSTASRGSYFDSRYQSVMSTAKMLKEHYLTVGGDRYNGTSVIEVNQSYCFLDDKKTVDYKWSTFVTQIAQQLRDKANKK